MQGMHTACKQPAGTLVRWPPPTANFAEASLRRSLVPPAFHLHAAYHDPVRKCCTSSKLAGIAAWMPRCWQMVKAAPAPLLSRLRRQKALVRSAVTPKTAEPAPKVGTALNEKPQHALRPAAPAGTRRRRRRLRMSPGCRPAHAGAGSHSHLHDLPGKGLVRSSELRCGTHARLSTAAE